MLYEVITGDALGAPVEFMDFSEILAHFGPNGISEYAPAYGRRGGAVTDDLEAVRRIAVEVGSATHGQEKLPPVICGLARASTNDIRRAWEAVRNSYNFV